MASIKFQKICPGAIPCGLTNERDIDTDNQKFRPIDLWGGHPKRAGAKVSKKVLDKNKPVE